MNFNSHKNFIFVYYIHNITNYTIELHNSVNINNVSSCKAPLSLLFCCLGSLGFEQFAHFNFILQQRITSSITIGIFSYSAPSGGPTFEIANVERYDFQSEGCGGQQPCHRVGVLKTNWEHPHTLCASAIKNNDSLMRVAKNVSKILGFPQRPLSEIYTRSVSLKALSLFRLTHYIPNSKCCALVADGDK